jgi:hypothetical protein
LKNKYPEILTEIVKASFLEKEDGRILELLKSNKDRERLHQQIVFHGLRPAAFYAFKKFGVTQEDFPYTDSYQEFTTRQAFQQLGYSHLIKSIFNDFKDLEIRAMPYKGVLFSNLIYDNKVLRESGDMDLLVYPDDARKALNYFIENEYEFEFFNRKFDNSRDLDTVDLILNSKGKNEFSFHKNGLHIDLHWGLTYGFKPYKVDYFSFFDDLETDSSLPVIPAVQTIFWMIVLHHGGKEFWVKQRHLIDLMAFLNKYSAEMDWEKQIRLAKEFKLFKSMITGFYLINKMYDFRVPNLIQEHFNIISSNQIAKILDFHSYSKKWNTLFARIRYENVLISNQDEGFSVRKYVYEIYKEYSMPNPLEHGRFITFPEKYRFLNFISKIITYGIKKMF